MSNAQPIDLSAIPESQHGAVLALLQENGALKDANRRLEQLIAEQNHVMHGKRFGKLSEDDRQMAFEDLKAAVAEVETRKKQTAPSTTPPRRTRQRNLGHLPADLPRIERVIEPTSLDCSCGYGHMHRSGEARTFLHNGRVEMDSSSVENLIRTMALRRKNALFAGHDEGGHTWARIASLIATASRTTHRDLWQSVYEGGHGDPENLRV